LIKVELQWFSLGPVKILYEALKPEDYYKNPLLPKQFKNYGVYMYLDKGTGKARYIGQAFNRKLCPLGYRVRWEITKDGNGCAESVFFKKCKKYNVDRFDLMLKVANITKSKRDNVDVEVDDKMMNAIERALIFERVQAGDPLMNETGKKRYRLEPIEIINIGDFSPLQANIVEPKPYQKL